MKRHRVMMVVAVTVGPVLLTGAGGAYTASSGLQVFVVSKTSRLPAVLPLMPVSGRIGWRS